MKKSIPFLFLAFLLVGCSNNSNSSNSDGSIIDDKNDVSTLVAYFSRTNNTEKVADYIIDYLNTERYEIEAKIPYTDEDIKYYTDCRADREQNDPTARPEIGSEAIDISQYDVVYLGYPIWHGQAPKIMYTFIESYDFSNKTFIPFCTSASSGIGSSATNLSKSAPNAKWLDGRRFSSTASQDEVLSWLKGLKY